MKETEDIKIPGFKEKKKKKMINIAFKFWKIAVDRKPDESSTSFEA